MNGDERTRGKERIGDSVVSCVPVGDEVAMSGEIGHISLGMKNGQVMAPTAALCLNNSIRLLVA